MFETAFMTPVVLLTDGLLAGMFIGSSLVEHAARTMSAAPWIAYKHAKERVFAPVMPIVFNLALLITIAAAVLLPGHWLLAVAAVLLAVVLGVTVKIHLPLNKMFQSWSAEAHPVTWDAGRARWRNWNIGRAVLVVAAFGLVVAGAA